jgi:hypothetical protein
MIGYATWRIIQGVADLEREGSDFIGLAKRAVYVAIGLTYFFFSAYALGILFGWSTEEGQVQDWTAMILGWPLGRWLIGLAGLGTLWPGSRRNRCDRLHLLRRLLLPSRATSSPPERGADERASRQGELAAAEATAGEGAVRGGIRGGSAGRPSPPGRTLSATRWI